MKESLEASVLGLRGSEHEIVVTVGVANAGNRQAALTNVEMVRVIDDNSFEYLPDQNITTKLPALVKSGDIVILAIRVSSDEFPWITDSVTRLGLMFETMDSSGRYSRVVRQFGRITPMDKGRNPRRFEATWEEPAKVELLSHHKGDREGHAYLGPVSAVPTHLPHCRTRNGMRPVDPTGERAAGVTKALGGHRPPDHDERDESTT